jgi:hypothetical protein
MGVGLLACGGALLGAMAWRLGHRSTPEQPASQINQPLSQSATALSPKRTELPVPATPAVDDEGTVVVRVDAANARIELDGQLIAQSASGARLRVEPGEHALGVSAPGRHRYLGRVNVTTGGTVELPVHLRRDNEPAAATPVPAPAASVQAKKAHDRRADPDYLVDPFSGSK